MLNRFIFVLLACLAATACTGANAQSVPQSQGAAANATPEVPTVGDVPSTPLQPPQATFPITLHSPDGKSVLAVIYADGHVVGDRKALTALLADAKGPPSPESVLYALIVRDVVDVKKQEKKP